MMGATNFQTTAEGKTAAEAFRAARERALYDYGHRGYTGTIAEKHEFVMVSPLPLPRPEAEALANELMDDDRISDKRGPAGAIPLDEGGYLFFGVASE